MPVSYSDVPWTTRNSTDVEDDGEDDETHDCADLDHGQEEFDFSIASDAKDLDDGQGDEEDGDPYTDIDVGRSLPELKRDTSSSDLEGQHGKPLYCVIPAHGKAPARVYEAAGVGEERAVDRIHDAELGKCLHDEVQHDSDDEETDDQRRRATGGKSTTRLNEESSTNRTTYAHRQHQNV